MLDVLRRNSKHWGVFLIVGSISVVMVMFFGTSYLNYNDKGWAASVDGDRIKMSHFMAIYSNRIEYLKKNMGEQFNEQLLKAFRLKENVLESLVITKIVSKEAMQNGILVSTEELKDDISNLPIFQKDGKFDFDYYKSFLVYNNYKASEFEAWRKEEMLKDKIRDFVTESMKMNDQDLVNAYKVENEKIKLSFFEVVSADDKGIVSEAAIDSFLKTDDGVKSAMDYFTKHNDTFKKDGKIQLFENVKKDIAKTILTAKKKTEFVDSSAGNMLKEKDLATAAKITGAKIVNTEAVTRKSYNIPGFGASSTNDVLWAFSLQKGKLYRRNIASKTYIVSLNEKISEDPAKNEQAFKTFKEKYVSETGTNEFMRYLDVIKKKWSGKVSYAASLMKEEAE